MDETNNQMFQTIKPKLFLMPSNSVMTVVFFCFFLLFRFLLLLLHFSRFFLRWSTKEKEAGKSCYNFNVDICIGFLFIIKLVLKIMVKKKKIQRFFFSFFYGYSNSIFRRFNHLGGIVQQRPTTTENPHFW